MKKMLLATALVLTGAAAFAQSDDTSKEDDVYYPNCAAARAVGAAPIYVGEPGYRRKLDPGGDGIACE